MPASFSPVSFPLMNMQQASPVASALANMMQMQKLRQQTAQSNFAPQLAQGQANIATGIGQQELGAGQFASPLAQAQLQNQLLQNKYFGPTTQAEIDLTKANTGLTGQQSKNVLQATRQMPFELGIDVYSKLMMHPKSLIATQTTGTPVYGSGISNLVRNLTTNIPNLTGSNLAAGMNATSPNFGLSGTTSTGGAKVNPDGSKTTSTGRKFVRDPSVPGGWRLA